jgi:hypothetical protein
VTDPTAAEVELAAVRAAADQRHVAAEACAVAAEQRAPRKASSAQRPMPPQKGR